MSRPDRFVGGVSMIGARVVIAAGAAFFACTPSNQDRTRDPEVPADRLQPPTMASQVPIQRPEWSSQLGGISEPTRMVIRNRAEWEVFWSTFAGARLPGADPPEVDFERSMVIVAAMGQRSTAGHDIAIASVDERAGELHVTVVEMSPGPGCITAQVITTPATAAVVPSHAGAVAFVEQRESVPC